MRVGDRIEYELDQDDIDEIKVVSAPMAHIMVGGSFPESREARANRAWEALGNRLGFDYMTVAPVPGKGERFITAVVKVAPQTEEEQVPYFGYIEVEVRLMREGFGTEGKEVGVRETRTVRIEERDAKYIGRACPLEDEVLASKSDSEMDRVETAIREVLDADEIDELRPRWDTALRNATPEQMRKALEALEQPVT